jgi:hypothetical protein
VKFISPTTGWAGGFNLNSSQEGMYKWANPPLSVSDNELQSGMNVYPVPSKGNVNIEFSSNTKDNITIKVFDVTGQRVFERTDRKSTPVYKTNINLSLMPAGVYMAVIQAGEKVFTKKIVIN